MLLCDNTSEEPTAWHDVWSLLWSVWHLLSDQRTEGRSDTGDLTSGVAQGLRVWNATNCFIFKAFVSATIMDNQQFNFWTAFTTSSSHWEHGIQVQALDTVLGILSHRTPTTELLIARVRSFLLGLLGGFHRSLKGESDTFLGFGGLLSKQELSLWQNWPHNCCLKKKNPSQKVVDQLKLKLYHKYT